MGGNGVKTHVNSKKKIRSTGKILLRGGNDQTHDAASSRTASSTHYQRAILAPYGKHEHLMGYVQLYALTVPTNTDTVHVSSR